MDVVKQFFKSIFEKMLHALYILVARCVGCRDETSNTDFHGTENKVDGDDVLDTETRADVEECKTTIPACRTRQKERRETHLMRNQLPPTHDNLQFRRRTLQPGDRLMRKYSKNKSNECDHEVEVDTFPSSQTQAVAPSLQTTQCGLSEHNKTRECSRNPLQIHAKEEKENISKPVRNYMNDSKNSIRRKETPPETLTQSKVKPNRTPGQVLHRLSLERSLHLEEDLDGYVGPVREVKNITSACKKHRKKEEDSNTHKYLLSLKTEQRHISAHSQSPDNANTHTKVSRKTGRQNSSYFSPERENTSCRNTARQPKRKVKSTNGLNWKPSYIRTNKYRRNRQSYNSKRRCLYEDTELDYDQLINIRQFYEERVKVDIVSKSETEESVNSLLDFILNSEINNRRFSSWADSEGSMAVGVKVGKVDESDHSVEVLIDNSKLKLSDQAFHWEYEDDDIDSNVIGQLSTAFVDSGKRFFPDLNRNSLGTYFTYIPNGFVAVKVGARDARKFRDCCSNRFWLLPYPLLSSFHKFVGESLEGYWDDVSLNKGARGPAVTLTMRQSSGSNISIDITLKLHLPLETLNVTDFKWPRHDTRNWLSGKKIEKVTNCELYLVPKGDKYWKISFANCECELLMDIDANGTWRKGCLRVVKKKFMQWQSQSHTGLKGLSLYLLKTTLLWLCEILPYDEYWMKSELANRYCNILEELNHRLERRNIGEYFNPSVNLLQNKNEDCINELQQFVQRELDDILS